MIFINPLLELNYLDFSKLLEDKKNRLFYFWKIDKPISSKQIVAYENDLKKFDKNLESYKILNYIIELDYLLIILVEWQMTCF